MVLIAVVAVVFVVQLRINTSNTITRSGNAGSGRGTRGHDHVEDTVVVGAN